MAEKLRMMSENQYRKESETNQGIEFKICQVLQEAMAGHDAKASITDLKDQISFVKKVMGINKGMSGHSNLKNEVLRIQESMMKHTPDERHHRLLNVYVNSYLEKLSLIKPADCLDNS